MSDDRPRINYNDPRLKPRLDRVWKAIEEAGDVWLEYQKRQAAQPRPDAAQTKPHTTDEQRH